MRQINNGIFRNILLTVLVFLVIATPIILFCYETADFSYLITSFILALPVAFLTSSIKSKPIFTILLTILLVCSLTELVMVKDFHSFILSGNLLSILKTNPQESASFAKNNLMMLLYFLPVVLVFSIALICYSKTTVNWKFQLVCAFASLVLAGGYISYKQVIFYHGCLTNKYFFEKNVFTRPPYNFFFQIRNAVKTEKMRKYIKESEGFSFGAAREDEIRHNEIYVLGIGESLSYDHISLDGQYFRNTTPMLRSQNNVVSYSNYYSGACLTMFSVPQIITRATPDNYELNFKEKSIIQPFKEVGFKTFAIENGNLLGYETYLTNGVDSLIHVKRDIEIPHIIDSLSAIYPKTFFVTQFIGCHSYYHNYEKDFDVFRPNINTDPDIVSDSLYINAYDNTILYADYVLSEIVRVIDKPGYSSAMTFISDHGENLSSGGGGHGGDCNPRKVEYHVPLIVWYSQAYSELFPDKIHNLIEHKAEPVCCDNIFFSVCDMAHIELAEEYWNPEYSFFSSEWTEHKRLVLLPDGFNTIEPQ